MDQNYGFGRNQNFTESPISAETETGISVYHYRWRCIVLTPYISFLQMIRMVPAAQTAQNNLSDFDPNHSLSQVVLGSTALADPTVLDFDLDYFPADSDCSDLDLQLNSPADFQVASSPSDQKVCFSPSLTTDLDYCSLTMFSPEASKMSSGGHATPDIRY